VRLQSKRALHHVSTQSSDTAEQAAGFAKYALHSAEMLWSAAWPFRVPQVRLRRITAAPAAAAADGKV
jgi:hypothetical protein